MTTPDQPEGTPGQQPGQQPGQSGQGWGQPQQPGPQSGPSPQPGQPWGQPGQPAPDQTGRSWAGQPGHQWPGQQGQPPQGQPGQGQPWQQGQGEQGQQPWGAQPGSPAAAGQPWSGQQAFGQLDPKKSGARKWLPIAGGAVVVLAVGAALLGGLGGTPEIGDCITAEGTSYETVDCDSDEAQYRVIGTDEDMTQAEFYADPDTCADAAAASEATSGVALWSGTDEDSDGQVFCAEAI